MSKLFVRNLVSGKLSKKQFMSLYIPAVLFLVVAWGVARALYFGDSFYEIETNYISNQGNLTRNPIGAWFFILSTMYMGLILSLFFPFLYQQLTPRVSVISELMLISGVLGGIGLAFVGMFPENINTWVTATHMFGATMAFTGLSLGAVLSLSIMIINTHKNNQWNESAPLIILLIMISFFLIMLLPTNEPSVRQWTGFYTIFIWANSMFLLLPDDSENKVSDIQTAELNTN